MGVLRRNSSTLRRSFIACTLACASVAACCNTPSAKPSAAASSESWLTGERNSPTSGDDRCECTSTARLA